MKILSQARFEQILRILKSGMDSFAQKKDTVLETSLSRGRRGDVGGGSFAFGNSVKASGSCAFAIGRATNAEGNYSFAAGLATTAGSDYQNVYGKCNVIDTSSEYAEIVGNGEIYSGSGVIVSSRSNARALDWSGNEHLAGTVYVNCNDDSTGGSSVFCEADEISERDAIVLAYESFELPHIASYSVSGSYVTVTIENAVVGTRYGIIFIGTDPTTGDAGVDSDNKTASTGTITSKQFEWEAGLVYSIVLRDGDHNNAELDSIESIALDS